MVNLHLYWRELSDVFDNAVAADSSPSCFLSIIDLIWAGASYYSSGIRCAHPNWEAATTNVFSTKDILIMLQVPYSDYSNIGLELNLISVRNKLNVFSWNLKLRLKLVKAWAACWIALGNWFVNSYFGNSSR